MDRVAQLHAAAVLALSHPGRELAVLVEVHAAERVGHGVACFGVLRWQRVKEPPAHDLEGLVTRRWLPLRRRAGHDVLELLQRGAAPRAAHFNLRGGDRYQHHHVGRRGGGLGEGLRERELGVEVPAGEAFCAAVDGAVAQLAGVGDPFVDEHHRRAEPLEQRRESRAGAGASDVVGGHDVVALFAAELVGETTPQGVQHDVVADRLRCRWRDLLTHQHRPVDLSGQSDLRFGQHIGQPRQLVGVGTRSQVVQGDQRVGLAATEVGLQLDHRVPALACQPLGRSREQVAQPLR